MRDTGQSWPRSDATVLHVMVATALLIPLTSTFQLSHSNFLDESQIHVARYMVNSTVPHHSHLDTLEEWQECAGKSVLSALACLISHPGLLLIVFSKGRTQGVKAGSTQ